MKIIEKKLLISFQENFFKLGYIEIKTPSFMASGFVENKEWDLRSC
jgi:hypothetical protein